jgi:hypothetical protein
MTDFQSDPEIIEFTQLRAIANGEESPPVGETSDERFAREERAAELYRLLKADDRLPRLPSTIKGFGSGRRQSGTRGFA